MEVQFRQYLDITDLHSRNILRAFIFKNGVMAGLAVWLKQYCACLASMRS
jgi:hypothetical protein